MDSRTSLWLVVLALTAACSAEPFAPAARQDTAALRLERGRYLVEHAAGCPHCHSPKDSGGGYDRARWLSGVDCYVDVILPDPNAGCLSTRNLTNHATGLKNRSDQEIKNMISKGVRPDGKALHPFMPYPYYGNMHAEDVDAIVAYLRTVPGVERTARPSQPPFVAPPAPAPTIEAKLFPMPRAAYAEHAAALRGRYLATSVSVCVSCHTPRENGKVALDKAFQGGMSFPGASLGAQGAYPEQIYSSNITPHATGIAEHSIADVVRAIKHGVDRAGRGICPPMPAGPSQPFGGITDRDAQDIAHYLFSLAPIDNTVPNDCYAPPPSGHEHAAR